MLAWIIIAVWIVNSVVVIPFLIYDNRESTHTLAWMLALMALPIIGLVLFFFFGRDWQAKEARRPATQKALAAVREAMCAFYAEHPEPQRFWRERYPEGSLAEDISQTITKVNGSSVLNATSLDLIITGQEKFARLERDVAAARHFVHLQYFIWKDDPTVARITAALIERIRAGVTVRVTYDTFGCLRNGKKSLGLLRDAGAEVAADVADLTHLNYRNHRKMVVIDGRIGYTGGMNMAEEYATGGLRFASWRDTHMRLTGPIVGDLQRLFAMRWHQLRGEDLFGEKYVAGPLRDDGDEGVLTQIVAQTVEDYWNSAYRAHLIAISKARHHVWLQSPYYVPPPTLQDALIHAALTGVDVRFMMTAIPDKKVPFWAAHSYFPQLLKAGVRIFVYEAGFFHAKTLSADSEVLAVGTMNLDTRSLILHKELMVWVYDEAVASRHEAIFVDDMTRCHEVTLRDLEETSRLERFRDSAARLTSNVM